MATKSKLSKETINIIRTTLRNNIELTNIADNKANVLLSLNGIMLTFLTPMIIGSLDFIVEKWLFIPLLIWGMTCFVTMYLSASVLKPASLNRFKEEKNPEVTFSPFFFGNFYQMESHEFYSYMEEALANKEMLRHHLAQDLFFIGKRLAFKMNRMRLAFNIFLIGTFLTLLSLCVVFTWY